jgi:hypothetical protein
MPAESGDNKLLGNFRKLVDIVYADPNYNPWPLSLRRAAVKSS